MNEERVHFIQSDLLASESIGILCLQETWLVRSQMPGADLRLLRRGDSGQEFFKGRGGLGSIY